GPDFAGQFLAAVAPTRPHPGRKPLAGLRVLDFGWVWSAPQMGSILAQLGAEVIKVEHGKRLDNARMSGTVIRDGQKVEGDTTAMSPMFHQINKNKLGITLNTKLPQGVELARRLAAVSDVVLENMSVGSIDRAGLGYAELSALNPRLVMVAMTGAGQFGPLADMRTYAPAMSSFAGMESLVGYPGERPVGALNFAVGDPNAAVHGLVALFGALARRDAIGSGCYIDLSQTEALLATLAPYMLQAQVEGRQPEPGGNAHPTVAPHGIYRAAGTDRWLSLAAQDDSQWAALAAMIEAEAPDERFSTAPGRIAAKAELDRLIESWTAGQDRDALVTRLRQAGIAAAPVQDIGEMWSDEQLTARGMKGVAELPGLGTEDLFRAPWLFSDFKPPRDGRGPLLGEHNGPVLKGLLGLSDAEFDGLVADGVIA
ncbi:MAG: CaiB/BaiF CoA transferase family protein, partial [Janthinobacterium lividum]